ncbi:MAG: flagellar basal body-associated FliL family protein [Lachnospiraceae bacterium]|nr:flagellar basal body-associated FliL family protein [Lachnospiraceae bacterium]MBQ6026324.1 flagellar basal body-associated FliL family protein [Lachnospiraceae bacterium]MBR3484418.1 flagellar basal body-associated FliL family protein [Lachnospiraceae bacterium]MBR3580277.1 flagellar basal body-associated FliL family protein [Lachnospiraceae bacterium]MBR4542380.1 flagellar basal body-associated FliL family protein [Lachnospiraceae bacterium]
MKKNMLTVLVLILCIVNLTLSAYIVFTVVPNAQRTDQLITKILQIIDLELESPNAEDTEEPSYNIENIEKYTIDESKLTTNLATGPDGKTHYAKIMASLTINNADEDYKTLNPKVETMESDIISIIKSNVSKYNNEELTSPETKDVIKNQILTEIQTLFNSKFIVGVTVDYLIQ